VAGSLTGRDPDAASNDTADGYCLAGGNCPLATDISEPDLSEFCYFNLYHRIQNIII
jgi:hypothetical protein